MTTNESLQDVLGRLGASLEEREWSKIYSTLEEVYDVCPSPSLLFSICNEKKASLNWRQLRLWGCWCMRNTPLSDGKKTWDLLDDLRSKHAIEVAEQYARAEVMIEELKSAGNAARSANKSAIGPIKRSVSAGAAACATVSYDALYVSDLASLTAYWFAKEIAGGNGASMSIAWSAAQSTQADAFREFISNPCLIG